jgi:hypothetical protein
MLDKFFIYMYIFLDIDALPVISWIIEQHSSIVALTLSYLGVTSKKQRQERLIFIFTFCIAMIVSGWFQQQNTIYCLMKQRRVSALY